MNNFILSASLNSTNMCASFPTHCTIHNKNYPLLYNLLSGGKVIYHTVLCNTMIRNEHCTHAWSILRYHPTFHLKEFQQWYIVPSKNSNLVPQRSVENM